MGKEWDSDKGGRAGWVAWMTEVMRECHRVMKPGAHGLVWAIPRTSHWTATALEDAGFEVRDVITHLFGQGFPKSLDISKAINKAAGAKREIIGDNPNKRDAHVEGGRGFDKDLGGKKLQTMSITAPSTDAAKQWAGWGTALKPASEHWILVRKPCEEKTVAANVLEWGTGGLNIDGCRIREKEGLPQLGRFPANLVLSHTPYCTDEQCDIECATLALDAQSGTLKSGERKAGYIRRAGSTYSPDHKPDNRTHKANSGGASRFFYCAKISPSERGDGNNHPTVKPQKLMRYLCRLITPPGGTVLDPFMGSGSTGMAAKAEGFKFVGIEKQQEYFEIARARIASRD
jgi:site-specific DNA-methyltransferase (adenine-specific)